MINYALLYISGLLANFFFYPDLSEHALKFVLIITIVSILAKPHIYNIFLGLLAFLFGFLILYISIWSSHLLYKDKTLFEEPHDILIKIKKVSRNYIDASIKDVVIGDELKSNYKGLIRFKVPFKFNMERFRLGQLVWVKAHLNEPIFFNNPGGFNTKKFYWLNGILGEAKLKQYCLTGAIFPSTREKLQNIVVDKCKDIENKGIIVALLFGDKSNIEASIKKDFAKTGTAHLIAISGLHISLIFLFVFKLLTFICPSKEIAMRFIAVGFATFYAYLAGFDYPCLRALLFLLLGLYFRLFSSGGSGFRILTISFLVISTLSPLAIFQYGFWLSFAASGFIEIFSGYKIKSKIIRYLVFQYGMCLAMMPITITGLESQSYLLNLSNIYAVPIFSILVIPMLFLFLVLSLLNLNLVSEYVLVVIEYILSKHVYFQNLLIQYAGDVFTINIFERDKSQLTSMLIIIVSILFFRSVRGNFLLLISLMIVIIGAAKQLPNSGSARIYIIDVGQGTGIVIRTRAETIIYDTGTSKATKMAMIPFLRYLGVTKIDKLIISHWDKDHSGGLDDLLNNFIVADIISHTKTKLVNKVCSKEYDWESSGVSFNFMPIYEDLSISRSENNKSCILKITASGNSFLALGDIDNSAERRLIHKYENKLVAGGLLVPHHGSRSSSSQEILEAVSPGLAVISAGKNNPYRHPHASVLQRLQKIHAKILTTFDCGLITYELTNKVGKTKFSCYSS